MLSRLSLDLLSQLAVSSELLRTFHVLAHAPTQPGKSLFNIGSIFLFLHCDKRIGRLQGSITFVGVGNHRGSWEGRSHPKVSQNVTSCLPGTLDYYYSSGRKPVTSIPIGRDAARHHGSPPVFRTPVPTVFSGLHVR